MRALCWSSAHLSCRASRCNLVLWRSSKQFPNNLNPRVDIGTYSFWSEKMQRLLLPWLFTEFIKIDLDSMGINSRSSWWLTGHQNIGEQLTVTRKIVRNIVYIMSRKEMVLKRIMREHHRQFHGWAMGERHSLTFTASKRFEKKHSIHFNKMSVTQWTYNLCKFPVAHTTSFTSSTYTISVRIFF